MKQSKPTCESTVALSQLKFYCKVTEILSEYSIFYTNLLKTKPIKGPHSLKSEDSIISFTQVKTKELLDAFKNLQTEVLKIVKDLEEARNISLSFDYSDISESPKTPSETISNKKFHTPQTLNLSSSEKLVGKLKTQNTEEKKSRIKKFSNSQLPIARCLFKN